MGLLCYVNKKLVDEWAECSWERQIGIGGSNVVNMENRGAYGLYS